MQEAAPLAAVARDVLVLGAQDRIAAQDGVAVMAVVVDGIAAVGDVVPNLVGEEIVLRFVGPVVEARGVAAVLPQHLLQEDDVRVERAQTVAQLVDHHAAVELREALVDVVGGDMQIHAGLSALWAGSTPAGFSVPSVYGSWKKSLFSLSLRRFRDCRSGNLSHF